MLQEQFPDLTQLYGQGPLSGYMGGVQTDNARKSQQINQQGALQDMYQKEQMLPVDMGMKQAQTRNYDASTQHMGENTRGAKYKNDMNELLKDDNYKAAKSKLAAEMSNDEIAQTHNNIKQLMLDDRTSEVGQRLRMMFDDVFPDYVKNAQRHGQIMEQLGVKGDSASSVAGIRAGAKGSAGEKPMTMSQWEAAQRLKAMQGDSTAMEAIAVLEEDRRAKAAAGAAVGDARTRELLGTTKDTEDNSSTGKVAPKQPALQPGQYEKGKQYKGQTGTYEYVGGDPKDKASWKKVN